MTGKPKIVETAESGAFLYVPNLYPEGVVLPSAGDPVIAAAQIMAKVPTLPPRAQEFVRQNPEQALEMLMERFELILIVIAEGEVSVFSSRRQNKLPNKVLQRLKREFGIWNDTPVGWFGSLNSNPAKTVANEVLYGKPLKIAKPSTVPPPGQRRTLARKKFWGMAESIVDELLT